VMNSPSVDHADFEARIKQDDISPKRDLSISLIRHLAQLIARSCS
jgi:hypothetical protein